MREVYRERNPCLESPYWKISIVRAFHTQSGLFWESFILRELCRARNLYRERPMMRVVTWRLVCIDGGLYWEKYTNREILLEIGACSERSIVREICTEVPTVRGLRWKGSPFRNSMFTSFWRCSILTEVLAEKGSYRQRSVLTKFHAETSLYWERYIGAERSRLG